MRHRAVAPPILERAKRPFAPRPPAPGLAASLSSKPLAAIAPQLPRRAPCSRQPACKSRASNAQCLHNTRPAWRACPHGAIPFPRGWQRRVEFPNEHARRRAQAPSRRAGTQAEAHGGGIRGSRSDQAERTTKCSSRRAARHAAGDQSASDPFR
eukprot:scaffold3183_cov120-Isochrysis_galbana.AAC.15